MVGVGVNALFPHQVDSPVGEMGIIRHHVDRVGFGNGEAVVGTSVVGASERRGRPSR